MRKTQGKKKVKKAVKKLTKKTIKKSSKKKVKKAVKRLSTHKASEILARSARRKAQGKSVKSEGNLIGLITHYFPHVQAAVIKLKKPLANGDTVKIKGHTTDLTQIVSSMQIDRVEISSAKKGDEIGLQVSSRVRQQDKVYKI
jgi:hypothetical protein